MERECRSGFLRGSAGYIKLSDMGNTPTAQMDWLTFISNMTAALAWPLVIAAVAFFYRKEIRHLVAGFRRLKVGPLEAEMFESRVREIRQLAVSLPERTERNLNATSESDKDVAERPAETAPRLSAKRESTASSLPKAAPNVTASDIEDDLLKTVEDARRQGTEGLAIRSTWTLVEDALRSFAERNGSNPNATVVTMLLDLKRRGLLILEEYHLLRQLYELRNMAASTTLRFSHEVLLDYVVAASEILRKTGLSTLPGRSTALRSVPLGVKVGE